MSGFSGRLQKRAANFKIRAEDYGYNAYDLVRWLLAHIPWAIGVAWDFSRDNAPHAWGFVRQHAVRGLRLVGQGVLWVHRHEAAGFWYLFDRLPDSFFGIPKHLRAQPVEQRTEPAPLIEEPRAETQLPPPMEGVPHVTVLTYPDDRSGPEYRHFDLGFRIGGGSSHGFQDGVLYDGYPRRPAPLIPQRIMERLMAMADVTYVSFIGTDMTVRIQNGNDWNEVEPRVFAALADAIRWRHEPVIERVEQHSTHCEHDLAGERVPIAA